MKQNIHSGMSLLLAMLFISCQLSVAVFAGETLVKDSSTDSSAIALGERIYNQGLLPSGESITGIVSGDIRMTGEQASCVSCHQHSAMGVSEGQEVVPALRGEMMFQDLKLPTSKPPNTPVLRPAYSPDSLRRAIRDGVGSNGEVFGALMPRYPLSDEQIDSVAAYLRSLSMQSSPGVNKQEIHFATVVGENIDPAARKAMLDVFDMFFAQKNSETRHETQRAEHAPWHKAWIMESYRKWVLHVWELKGPAESWPAQLEQYYRDQPVFALLSGQVDGAWRPLHQFCEDQQMPCLFPTTDLPVLEQQGVFSFYFDQGIKRQAEAVADHMLKGLESGSEVLQVYRAGDLRSETAAAAFKQRVQANGMNVRDLLIADVGSDWSTLSKNGVVAVWLSEADLQSLWKKVAETGGPKHIYLSTSLYGDHFESVPVAARDKVVFVHPYAMPDHQKRMLIRSNAWLRMKGVSAKDYQRVQANAYFTLSLTGMALKRVRGYLFRDYFIEGIEHMVDNALFTSVYPRISLAPGQRFVSKGVYMLKFSDKANAKPIQESDWLVQ